MHEGSLPFREAEDALPHAAGRDDRSTRPERRRRLHGGHDSLGHGDDRNRQVCALRGEAVLRHRRYAIAGVVAIVGAISVYIKMNNEEQDVKKSIMMIVGACIFLVAAAQALPLFFGISS